MIYIHIYLRIRKLFKLNHFLLSQLKGLLNKLLVKFSFKNPST